MGGCRGPILPDAKLPTFKDLFGIEPDGVPGIKKWISVGTFGFEIQPAHRPALLMLWTGGCNLPYGLIDFLVTADIDQQSFISIHEFENDPAIVSDAECPKSFKLSDQFVGSQDGIKWVLGKQS
jgi:hypothetical protein